LGTQQSETDVVNTLKDKGGGGERERERDLPKNNTSEDFGLFLPVCLHLSLPPTSGPEMFFFSNTLERMRINLLC